MAILKIARMGNPTLRHPAQPVRDPTAPAIRALVSDMVETMLDAGGVGLAAPQVRVPLRLVIFQLPPDRVTVEDGAAEDGAADGKGDADAPEGEQAARSEAEHLPLHVLINPVITPIGEQTALGWEGCLSLPRMRGLVPRFTHIRYGAIGLDGKPFECEASGFHARVVQHECDHLDGILYPMRMTDLSLLGYNDEWARAPLDDAGADAGAEADEAEAAE